MSAGIRSIRNKVVGPMAGILFLVIFVVGGYLPAQLSAELSQSLVAEGAATAELLAFHLNTAVEFEDTRALEEGIRGARDVRSLSYVGVHTLKGVLLAEAGAQNGFVATGFPTTTNVLLENYTLSRRPVTDASGMYIGVVTVVNSLASTARERARHQVTAGALCAVILFIGLLAVYFLHRSVLRPVGQLVDASNRVAKGNLTQRVPVEGRDEVAQLADAFNVMMEELRLSEESKREALDSLRNTVSELRETREELVQSTRLASVGEMAGRTAHEVLNPVTGILGRVTVMLDREAEVSGEELDVLKTIVSGWQGDYRDGGFDGLLTALRAPADEGDRPLIEEDFDLLSTLQKSFAEALSTRRTDLQFVAREIDRIVHIIDGMRRLTRQEGSREVASVEKVVRDSIDIIRDGATKRNIQVEFLAAEDSDVWVDPYELIQVLTNLLRNACLAVEEKSGRSGGHIKVSIDRGEDVEIRVQDSGTGIKPEHLARIFESSFTTRGASDGTGLGLGIARRLARGFAGEVVVESTEVGVGTVFLLTLPPYIASSDAEALAA